MYQFFIYRIAADGGTSSFPIDAGHSLLEVGAAIERMACSDAYFVPCQHWRISPFTIGMWETVLYNSNNTKWMTIW